MKKQILANKQFYVAMYLRLSKEDEDKDGISKTESNSIRNQRELIRTFIRENEDMELYDCYLDDGFSGSHYDRPEFQRMIKDIEAGKVNCVIVKDLSRFGRDYIETGRYLERIFPALGVRFIALTDSYDSLFSDVGEQSIVLPIKNFINDSYYRDISMKVKSQLAVKRRAGEYVGAFALYGYRKDPKNKNQLVPDAYAAQMVRKIFAWKIEGLAVSAIAKKLNEFGVLSPKEYKKSLGENYRGGFFRDTKARWGSTAVKRILTEETYLGHLLQGKTEKKNYKLKKSEKKPKEDWIRVEHTHEPIISEEDFQIVQNLLGVDGRSSPENGEVNPFMGILFCGDCGEPMIRRVTRYKDNKKMYYICSTKNRGEGCSRHSIEEKKLKELIEVAIHSYVNHFLEQQDFFEQARGQGTNVEAIMSYNQEILRLKKEQEKYDGLCSGLYEDLKQGILTKEEFERLKKEFEQKAEDLMVAQEKQKQLIQEMLTSGVLSASRLHLFQKSRELQEIDRYTLVSLVKRIYLYEEKRIEIEFYFQDPYRIMQDFYERAEKSKREREV